MTPRKAADLGGASLPFAAALGCGMLLGLFHPPAVLVGRVAVVGSAIALIAWIGAPHGWVLDLVRHFPVQLLLASLAATGVLSTAAGDAQVWVPLGVLAIVPWAIVVAPWLGATASGRTAPRPPGDRLRLFYANVLTESRAYGAVADLVAAADADVVALVEVDQEWLVRLALESRGYPHRVTAPRDAHFGLALYSRTPLQHACEVDLAGMGMPALVADLGLGPCAVRLLLVHTMPPKGPRRAAMRERQLSAAADILVDARGPVMLLGDLNVTPWSVAYRLLVRRTGLTDARAGHGLCPTWPALLPSHLRLPIDALLLGKGLRAETFEVGPAYGSDHRPLTIELACDVETVPAG